MLLRFRPRERICEQILFRRALRYREVEVLRLLARGLTKKEIAKALVIAPGTAHTHTVHIYEKLGVSTRAGVALFAVEHGLVRP